MKRKGYTKRILFVASGALALMLTAAICTGNRFDWTMTGYWIGYLIAYFFKWKGEKLANEVIDIQQELNDVYKEHINAQDKCIEIQQEKIKLLIELNGKK